MTLEEMKAVDIKTVDAETLVDINGVDIDMSLPMAERRKRFVEKIKNPYCYKVGDVVVKVRFADTDRTLDDCLEHYIRSR